MSASSQPATPAAPPLRFDPFRFEDLRDPYPAYRALRERAPVYRVPNDGGPEIWCVSRYDDVLGVLRSDDVFSSRAMFTMLMNQGLEGPPPLSPSILWFMLRMVARVRMNPFEFTTARNLIAEDGERHTAMRAIVNRGFTPRRIAAWEARAREVVAQCMLRLQAGDPFDVMRDLAVPLPVTLIAEMLGIEPERRADFKRWSDAVIHNVSGPGRATPLARPFQDALLDLTSYLRRVAGERRRAPSDDLISAILAEEDGAAALSEREVVQFVVLLLVAGNETTTNLIGNAVTALLDHPHVLERVAADPSLVPGVLEESLRYESPIQLLFRKANRSCEIAGTRIPEGAIVVPLLGSANRDERRFPDPDRFDPERDSRGHLGFGHGKHFCLGASLARLEARVALEALVPELPRLRRTQAERTLVDSFLVRGPARLELAATRHGGGAERGAAAT